MKGSFRFFSLFILIAVCCLFYLGCATTSQSMQDKKKVARYPKGYQDWTNTFLKVVLDKKSPFYGVQRVLVNKEAMDAYRNLGPYPEGSVLVLEFSEPVKEGEDIVKGHVNWVAVMIKDSSATETGGWRYLAFDGNPNVAIEKNIDPFKECHSCHMAVKHKGHVFSSLQKH